MAEGSNLLLPAGSLVWCKQRDSWCGGLLLDSSNDVSFYRVFLFGTHTICYAKTDDVQGFLTHLHEHVSESYMQDDIWKEGVVEGLVELYLDQQTFTNADLDNLILNDVPFRPNRIPVWVEELLNNNGKKNKITDDVAAITTQSTKRMRASQGNFKKGSLVWGKYGKNYWPAMVIEADSADGTTFKCNIMWLNDFTTTIVKVQDLLDFAKHFQIIVKRFLKRMSYGWKRGVLATLTELYNHERNFKLEDIETLAISGLKNVPIRKNYIPQSIQTILDKSQTSSNFDVFKNKCPDTYKKIIHQHLSKGKTLEGIHLCLGCYTDEEVCKSHPIVEGFVCNKCYDTLKRTLNIIGDDGFHFFCMICGKGGHTILCESPFCGKVYCIKCIEDFCKQGTWQSLVNQEQWFCFLCTGQQIGILSIKPDYNLEINKMLYSEIKQLPLVNAPSRPLLEGTKLRVLSLFDGIGTCLFALEKLKIPLDVYYASEIDPQCISVSKFHFTDKISHIGNVTHIKEKDIKRMSPIHLVVGGSPCIDLSLVNPARKGLFDPNGTGPLFFEFYRIIRLVSKYNKDGFYWLYENVAFMEICYKEIITRYLQCEPILKDAVHVSPQHRPRLFWGNLPLLLQNMPVIESNLQDVLWPYRSATVEKLATVTTKSNSLRQGKQCLYPVINEHNNPDVIHITELEKVFGFTPHYTDVCNMSAGQRQRLLGAAWSVPVIIHLFTPLQQFCKI